MSLKCSVFGHRFGDPDVEREREEQGSEVVITITETETCERCGETRVVSENKEVTTLETPSDIVGEDLDDSGTETEETTAAGSETAPAGSAESGGVQADADQPATDRPATGQSVPESATDQPAEEDAEIIDDEPIEEAEPSSGEPAEDTTAGSAQEPTDAGGGSDTAAGGDVDEASAGADAQEDDAVILDEAAEDDGDRAPGEWPQEDDESEDEDEDDWTPPADDGELRPLEEEQPTVEPTREAMTVPEGEFRCPECGFTTAVESSSLREGDFCPECHRGTLTHERGE